MRTLAAIVLLVVVALPASAQDAGRLDQVVQSSVQSGKFMGAVLVARGDTTVLDKGYGMANLEWRVPNTPATKFRLGSLTKQFTAASILLLEQRGKLSVDDAIKKYVTDAPAAWDAITIRHLLTHTSGIPSFTSLPSYRPSQPFATTPEKTIAIVRDMPLEFAPGEKMLYDNSGYILLGHIIEKVSGQSYAAFLQENIFTPLGMKDSGLDSNADIIDRRAAGYAPGANGPVNAGFIHMSIPFAAGAVYSTTGDLLRWEQGLFGGKVLSAASLDKMTKPFKNNYAFGLLVHSARGPRVVEHNGGIEGFNTAMAYYPDSGVIVIVLANLNGPTADLLAASLGAAAHETLRK